MDFLHVICLSQFTFGFRLYGRARIVVMPNFVFVSEACDTADAQKPRRQSVFVYEHCMILGYFNYRKCKFQAISMIGVKFSGAHTVILSVFSIFFLSWSAGHGIYSDIIPNITLQIKCSNV